jgi:hypothetical protein
MLPLINQQLYERMSVPSQKADIASAKRNLSTIVLMCFITLYHFGECRSVGDMKLGW